MKKEVLISIILFTLGFLSECIYLGIDNKLLSGKLWLIGMIFMFSGILGLGWYLLIPILERRAKSIGKIKKDTVRGKRGNL